MSPHAQTSFVNDLVVMAKAYEELPGVREELRTTRDQLEAALNTVQRLEGKLIDAHNTESELRSNINSLEVAVTSAELRFLEADVRTEKALAFVRSTFGNAGALIQALDPKPIASAASEPTIAQDQSADPLPTGERYVVQPKSPVLAGTVDDQVAVYATAISSEGQSEPGSTASSMDAPSTSALSIAENTDTAKSEENWNASGPYSGKRYYDHSFYVSLSGWLAGGGTEEDYTWRPSQHMIG